MKETLYWIRLWEAELLLYAAKKMNRNYLGFEVVKDYVEIVNKRIEKIV